MLKNDTLKNGTSIARPPAHELAFPALEELSYCISGQNTLKWQCYLRFYSFGVQGMTVKILKIESNLL